MLREYPCDQLLPGIGQRNIPDAAILLILHPAHQRRLLQIVDHHCQIARCLEYFGSQIFLAKRPEMIERFEHAELTDDERREHVEKPYRRGLEIRNTLALANPQNLLYRRAVGASERRLGQLLIERAGSIPDGLNHLQVAVTLQTKLHEEFPTDFTYARDAAIANFVMADGLIAANENVERIISVQQQGLTLLRNTCQTFPQQMDLLKDLFVAERRVADFLNLKTMDPTSRVEHLTEAIGHYENALRTIEKLKAAGITMVHLDEESKSVTELIAGCRREMIRIDKPQGQ